MVQMLGLLNVLPVLQTGDGSPDMLLHAAPDRTALPYQYPSRPPSEVKGFPEKRGKTAARAAPGGIACFFRLC